MEKATHILLTSESVWPLVVTERRATQRLQGGGSLLKPVQGKQGETQKQLRIQKHRRYVKTGTHNR